MLWLGRNLHDVSAGHLGAGALGDGLGDLLDLGAGDEQGDVEHVVTEGLDVLVEAEVVRWVVEAYRVGGNVDALLLAVLDQVVALENGVALDLVGGGDNAGTLDEGLELLMVSI